MLGFRPARTRVRVLRTIAIGLGLVPLVFGTIVGALWLHDHLADFRALRVRLALLVMTEIVYTTSVTTAVLGALTSLAFFARAWRNGRQVAGWGRGLLLSGSILISAAGAEAVCAGRQTHVHQTMVIPIGGLESDLRAGRTLRFPPPVVFPQLPTTFPDPVGDRAIDVVVVGESSAQGVPFEKWLSIGKVVAWGLEQAMPDRPVRLDGIAMSGDTLEGQHQKLVSLARRPEIMIIYCGHNEFSSRLWWSRDLGHYWVDQVPSRWERFVNGIEHSSAICGLLSESAAACRIALPPTRGGRGIVDVPLTTPAEFEILLRDFHRRVEHLVHYAESVGAVPVLIAPPANDAGYEPNRSYLPSSTQASERERFELEVLAARKAEGGGTAAGIARYRDLIARWPSFAECHFRLARLLEKQGEWDEAYEEYKTARDLDGYPNRCLTAYQDAYREAAKKHDCLFIDGQALFHAVGRHGQLDDLLFQDAMHPSLLGHLILSQAVLEGLKARGAVGWPKDVPAMVINPARCLEHFGFQPQHWKGICKWTSGFYSLTAMLRFDSDERLRKEVRYKNARRRIDEGARAETLGVDNLGAPPSIPRIPELFIR